MHVHTITTVDNNVWIAIAQRAASLDRFRQGTAMSSIQISEYWTTRSSSNVALQIGLLWDDAFPELNVLFFSIRPLKKKLVNSVIRHLSQ